MTRIELNTPSKAFGFSITDFGDQSSGALFIATDAGEASSGLTIATAPLSNGNELFFGFTQDVQFSSLTFFQTTTEDGIGIDGVYAQSVPEPNGMLVIALLLILVPVSTFLRKKKRLPIVAKQGVAG